MWLVRTPEGDVDLEGATVLRVGRSPGLIRIDVENARFVRGDRVELPRSSLVCENVKSEEARYYIGAGVQGQVEDRDVPVDDIEVVEFSGSTLEIHGYKAHKPWYMWIIECNSVRLEQGEARSAT